MAVNIPISVEVTFHEEDEEDISDQEETDYYYHQSHHGLTEVRHYSSYDCNLASVHSTIPRRPRWWDFLLPETECRVYLPHQMVIRVWQGLASGSIVFMCFLQFLAMSFNMTNSAPFTLVYLCDVIFIIDIVLKFHLAYMDSRGMLVVNQKAIKERYLKTTFALDIFSIFPFEIGAAFYSTKQLTRCFLFRMNRLLRYYQPIALMNLRESELGRSTFLYRCIKYFLICVMSTHAIACLWYQFACHTFYDSSSHMPCSNGSWAVNQQNDFGLKSPNMSTFDAYILSLYWAVATATSTGYGDVSAANTWEKFFSIVAMLTGIGVYFGMLLGGLTSMLTNLDQQRARYVHRFNTIQEHIKQTDCDEDLREQVIGYYEYLWVRKKGQSSVDGMYDSLPFTFRGELSHATYQCILEKAHMFDGCGKGFLRMLSMCIKPMLFLPDQIIISRGDVGHQMYFIHRGEVSVMSEMDDETPIATLKSGKMFGEISLILSTPRTATIRAATHCDLMVLEKTDLQKVLHQYPAIIKRLQEVAKQRCKTADNLANKKENKSKSSENFEAFRQRRSAYVAPPSFGARRKSFAPPPIGVNLRLAEDPVSLEDVSHHSITLSGSASIVRRRSTKRGSILGGGSVFNVEQNFNITNKRQSVAFSESFDLIQSHLKKKMDDSTNCVQRIRKSWQEFQEWFSSITIPPNSALLNLWRLIILVLMVVISFIYPFMACFTTYKQMPGHDRTNFVKRIMLAVTYILDIILAFDIIVNLRTAVETPHGALTDFKDIIQHYCKSASFYYDVFSVIPFEICALASSTHRWTYFAFLRLNRIVKIFRVPQWFVTIEDALDVNVLVIRSLKFLLYIILATHWVACGLFVNSCNVNGCIPNSWYTVWSESRGQAPNSTNLVTDYVTSVYYSVATMTSTGYGDIHAHFVMGRLLSLSAMVIGLLLYGYSLAAIAATLANLDAARVAFQERLFAVRQFLRERNVGKNLQEQVYNHMSMLWGRYKGQWIPGGPSMLHDIPMALQQDIAMDDMCSLLANVPLFRDMDDSFMRSVYTRVDSYMFAPRDVIVYAGELAKEMYVVRRGLCQIVSPDLSVLIAEIGPGQYFGDMAMLFGQYQLATVVAKTHAEVFQLKFTDLEEVLSDFPLVEDQINRVKKNTEMVKAVTSNLKSKFEKQINDAKNAQNASAECITGSEYHRKLKEVKPPNVKRFKTMNEDGSLNEDYVEPFRYLSNVGKFFSLFLLNMTFIPQSTLIKVWATMQVTLALILSFTIPLQMAFLHESIKLWIVHLLIDALSYSNIYFNFHIAYHNKDGVLITHPVPCAINYLRNNFTIDLLGCFPFELLCFAVHAELDSETLHLCSLVRITRLFICYRIPCSFTYFESNIEKETGNVRAIKFVVYMLIFLNALTCILFLVACPPNSLTANTFQTTGGHVCLMDSWLDKASNKMNIVSRDLWTMYSLSLYWASETTVSVGYGDISAHNDMEMVVASFAMILGVLFFGYIIASVAASLANADTQRANYLDKMLAIKDFMTEQGVPKILQSRLNSHYDHVWNRTKGVDPVNLLDGMPLSLWGDVTLSLYKDILSKISWFKDADMSFIKMLSKCLKPMLITEGEYIFRKHDIGNEVYFIHRGIVDVVVDHGTESMTLETFHAGQSFGEDAWLFNSPRPVSMKARINCDLFVLSKADLDYVLESYPSISGKIMQVGVEARQRARRHSQLARSFAPQQLPQGQMLSVPKRLGIRKNQSYIPPSDRALLRNNAERLGYPRRGLSDTMSPKISHTSADSSVASVAVIAEEEEEAEDTFDMCATHAVPESDPHHLRGDMSSRVGLESPSVIITTMIVEDSDEEDEEEEMENNINQNANMQDSNDTQIDPPGNDLPERYNAGTDDTDYLIANGYGWWRKYVYTEESEEDRDEKNVNQSNRSKVAPEEVVDIPNESEPGNGLLQRFLELNRFTIRHTSRKITYFKDFMCFLNFFTFLLIVYQATFVNGHISLLCLDYLSDVVYFVDIYIKFHCSFRGENGDIVMDFDVAFDKYLSDYRGFTLDMVAAFPIDIFALAAPREHRLAVLLYLRLLHLLRVLRLLQYFNQWEKELNINMLFVRGCKFFCIFTMIVHILSCVWYLISCPINHCFEVTWLSFTDLSKELDIYCTCVYWTIATMTSTGYGDVSAHTVTEMFYASFVMIVGKLMFGFILANIASTLSNAGVHRVQYEQKIQAVQSHMTDQGVPKFLHNRVVNYYNYLWMRNKGKAQDELVKDCPSCLKSEVYLSVTRPMLESIELFENATPSFLRLVCQRVQILLFMPGDYIVKKGDIGKEVHYIHRGEVDVVSDTDHNSVAATLRKGNIFGEVSLVGNLPRRVTVRARTHVDIYTLSKKDLDDVLKFYPDMRKLIEGHAKQKFGPLLGSGHHVNE